MGHYDDCRATGAANAAATGITEKDKLKLLKHILQHKGKISLYTEIDHWEWPAVRAMIKNCDERITYNSQGAGYKIATVEINSSILTDDEKTKILLL